MTEKNKKIELDLAEKDEDKKNSLRPLALSEFIGQQFIKSNLGAYIESSKKRKKNLDHIILYGPPGLGKTSLAHIISNEKNVNFHSTSGPAFTKKGDLVTLLSNMMDGDILFIDEIHRLSPIIEETLYPAMEDFQLDLMIGEGPAARSLRIDLPQFTLIAATTRSGLITTPLRDRFGIPMRLQFYAEDELEEIIKRAADKLSFNITTDGANEIARRSRGTPRVAGRLLRRVRDFEGVLFSEVIDAKAADAALERLEVDSLGLDAMDKRYLNCIARNYSGGPVGVDTLAAALSEQRDVIEEVIEPYLLQQGFIDRTPRGRVLSSNAYEYLGLKPKKKKAQLEMLSTDERDVYQPIRSDAYDE